MNNNHSVSLVIPVYNEEENIRGLYAELKKALARVSGDHEILFVDDGSSDQSLSLIRDIAAADEAVRYLSFAENCGQSAAFAAGFRAATGEVIITMDADLQNDPEDIPAMLAEYQKGYDMVIGWRAKRKDTWVKKISSRIANAVRNRLSRETVRDTGCSLKVMNGAMLKEIPMFTGMHRFLPTLMKLEGARVAEVQVNHRPRQFGLSKYGVWDRALSATHDLLAVRWMQKRHIRYQIRERK